MPNDSNIKTVIVVVDEIIYSSTPHVCFVAAAYVCVHGGREWVAFLALGALAFCLITGRYANNDRREYEFQKDQEE